VKSAKQVSRWALGASSATIECVFPADVTAFSLLFVLLLLSVKVFAVVARCREIGGRGADETRVRARFEVGGAKSRGMPSQCCQRGMKKVAERKTGAYVGQRGMGGTSRSRGLLLSTR
jgi:hypothetical protein